MRKGRPLQHCSGTSHAITCILQASSARLLCLPAHHKKAKLRSGCPVSISLETLGDRWSLLIIRDLMVRGLRTFKDFQESGEGIATNILAERLIRLEVAGIITATREEEDRRRISYRLTQKGIELAPVLLELLIWGVRHEKTDAPAGLARKLEQQRPEFLKEIKRRWREEDPNPLLPRF